VGSGLREPRGDYSATTRPLPLHYPVSTPMKKVEKKFDIKTNAESRKIQGTVGTTKPAYSSG